ncbi:MAG: CheB methylesterase domain-containing protein [Thermoanaerobacteraceae bacterium]
MLPKCIVLIGSSTGGPKALQFILERLPEDINVPIIIVQHMPSKFTKLMSERFNLCCKIRVKEAEDGEVIKNSVAYIAPGDKNLLVIRESDTLKIKLSTEYKSIYHPSIDATIISASKLDIYIVTVVLTGMGSDGSIGIKFLNREKSYIISQDEKSSIAKGMPFNAAKTGLVDKILSLEDIPNEIIVKVREHNGK